MSHDEDLPTRLTARLRGLANRKTLIVSGVVFGLAAGLLFASSAPFSLPEVEQACGQVAPDVRFFTSADGLDQFLTECGPDGRAAYRNLQLADLIYPALAGLFPAMALILVIDRLQRHRPGARDLSALALLPLLGAAFDYVENAVAWTALAAFPSTTPLGSLFGVASVAKQVVNWASWLLLLAALLALAVSASKVGRRQSQQPIEPQAS